MTMTITMMTMTMMTMMMIRPSRFLVFPFFLFCFFSVGRGSERGFQNQIDSLKGLLVREATNLDYRSQMARYLAWDKKYRQSQEECRRIISQDSLYWPAYEILASAQAWDGEHFAAIATLQDLVIRNPKSVSGWFLLGKVYRWTHQHRESQNAFRTVLKLQPNHAQAKVQISTITRAPTKREWGIRTQIEQDDRISTDSHMGTEIYLKIPIYGLSVLAGGRYQVRYGSPHWIGRLGALKKIPGGWILEYDVSVSPQGRYFPRQKHQFGLARSLLKGFSGRLEAWFVDYGNQTFTVFAPQISKYFSDDLTISLRYFMTIGEQQKILSALSGKGTWTLMGMLQLQYLVASGKEIASVFEPGVQERSSQVVESITQMWSLGFLLAQAMWVDVQYSLELRRDTERYAFHRLGVGIKKSF